MLEDFLSYLFHAVFILVSILFARVAVDMMHAGRIPWKSYACMLTLTFLGFAFVCDIMAAQYDQHWGKLIALGTVQSLAFVYFKAARSSAEVR